MWIESGSSADRPFVLRQVMAKENTAKKNLEISTLLKHSRNIRVRTYDMFTLLSRKVHKT